MRLVIPARQCLHRRKPLNHREEQDLDHVRYVLGRSHCQVGSMLHLYNAKQKVLWDQHKGAEAVTPAVPHKAIVPQEESFTGWSEKAHWKCRVAHNVTPTRWCPQEESLHTTYTALLLLPVIPASSHGKVTAQKRPGIEADNTLSIWSRFFGEKVSNYSSELAEIEMISAVTDLSVENLAAMV